MIAPASHGVADLRRVRHKGLIALPVSRFALLFVVFLDVMSQGLVIPILTTILLDPANQFLPHHTASATRQVDYGVVMGVFFLSWFLGAAYISKLSDSIGRKAGILICLSGNLLGYALTIVALLTDSLVLLIVARAISGFTAGNQPIAEAALVDLSTSEAERTRYLGLVLTALSLGLVVGPLMAGFMSDSSVIGPFASLELPFYAVSLLVVVNIILVVMFFHDTREVHRPVKVRPVEVFLTLYEVAKHPTVLRLSLVFFFAQLALNAYYIFMDNYFFDRFQFGTVENSIALVVIGAASGLASAFLVSPINQRFGKIRIISVCLFVMGISAIATIFNPWPLFAYVLIVPFMAAFAVYYPTIVTMFSTAVDDGHQGWVMGVTVALYTLGAGLTSLIGSGLVTIDIHLPFMISALSALIALGLIVLFWRSGDIRRLDRN